MMKTTLSILLLSAGLASAIDLDGNGLDDVWEMIYFGQTGNDPDDDPDEDGAKNLAECGAATDPFDKASRFEVLDLTDLRAKRIEWTTRPGKRYRLEYSDDLSSVWSNCFDIPAPGGTRAPVQIPGSGGPMGIDVTDPGRPLIKGGATRELWLGTGGSANVNDFKTTYLGWPDSDTPATGAPTVAPTGTEGTDGLQAPSNARDQYGQRLCGYIHAPESGDYTFYIAGRHQCEFWLSTVPDSGDPANLGRVLRQTTTNILTPTNWHWHTDNGIDDQQASAPVTLEADRLYYFEALHRHWGQEDHLAVGWTRPSAASNSIEVIPGEWICPRIDLTGHNAAELFNHDLRHFRIATYGPEDAGARDSDNDGIDDGTEGMLDDWDPYADNSAVPGQSDLTSLSNALAATDEQISVITIDERATEDTGIANNGLPRYRDVARFQIERRGSLRPLTVFFTLGGGDDLADDIAEEEESPEAADYNAGDIHGTPMLGSISFPGGRNRAQIVIAPNTDEVFEYPETVSLQIDPHSDYTIDLAAERSEAKIYDVRNVAGNEILFVGFSLPQPGSIQPKGSAICSGKLNANRDQLTLFTSITAGFSAPQSNSHVHKDEGTPGSDPVTFSLPPNGEIANMEWRLCENGSYRPQKMIDSLFNQVDESTTGGETKLYVNWHTDMNLSGELYAFLCPAEGSVVPPDPDAPPAIVQIDPVTQDTELRREIVRFLNQATFGATQTEVDAMYNRILATPGQDRIAAYGAWMDEQLDPTITTQTRLLEYTLASDWQSWVQRGFFDPSFYEPGDWGSNGEPDPPIVPPALPSPWPRLDNHDPETVDYTRPNGVPGFTQAFPLSQRSIDSVRRFEDLNLGQEQRRSDRHALWTAMINSRDQLRQRMAFAWSQILVISAADGEIGRNYFGKIRYWDMLAENADDTFREMLEGVTYSPMMGQYLSHLKNAREADLDNDGTIDVFPDENYAREIMQLFSIGLFKLHLDGTLALDPEEGLPQATYDNQGITELARVFTGLSYSKYAIDNTQWNAPLDNDNFTRSNGNPYYGSRYDYPMKMFGEQHDSAAKTLPDGLVIDNSGLATDEDIGHADLARVHDWLAGSGAAPYDGHASTPPFLARRLIQRLVTSNPPRDYIHRVATVFEQTGGDLRAVTKAILLDYHARSPEIIDDTYGRKKPPLVAYTQLVRGLEAGTLLPVSELGNSSGDGTDYGLSARQRNNYSRDMRFRFGETDDSLSMTPQGALTVFNFFLPDYAPGGSVATASLTAPEFQILNEISAIQNINAFYAITWFNNGQQLQSLPNQEFWGYGANDDHVIPDRTPWMSAYANNIGLAEWEKDQRLVDAIDEILNAGALQTTYTLDPADRTPAAGDLVVVDPDPNPYEAMIDALTESYADNSANGIRDKVRLAWYLMSVSPSFQVQR